MYDKSQDARRLCIRLLGIMGGLTVPYVQEQITISFFIQTLEKWMLSAPTAKRTANVCVCECMFTVVQLFRREKKPRAEIREVQR